MTSLVGRMVRNPPVGELKPQKKEEHLREWPIVAYEKALGGLSTAAVTLMTSFDAKTGRMSLLDVTNDDVLVEIEAYAPYGKIHTVTVRTNLGADERDVIAQVFSADVRINYEPLPAPTD